MSVTLLVASGLGCQLPFILLSFQNRVVHQNPGERNYHIFYALLAGVSGEQKGNGISSSYAYVNENAPHRSG